MELTLDQWLRLAQTVALLLSAGLNAYLFYKTRNTTQAREHRKAMKQIEDDRRSGDAVLHKRLDKISGEHHALITRVAGRLSVVETTVKHLPTHDDIAKVREDISELSGNVQALGERSLSNNQMLHTIHAHLLKVDE